MVEAMAVEPLAVERVCPGQLCGTPCLWLGVWMLLLLSGVCTALLRCSTMLLRAMI